MLAIAHIRARWLSKALLFCWPTMGQNLLLTIPACLNEACMLPYPNGTRPNAFVLVDCAWAQHNPVGWTILSAYQ